MAYSRLAPVIGLIWLSGASVLGGIATWRSWKLRRLIKSSAVKTGEHVEDLLHRLARQLKVRRSVRLAVVDEAVGPAAFGVTRSTIILPRKFVDGASPSELEPVLAHELIHVRRHDGAVGLLQTVAQIVWWFHPLVWWANHQATRQRELCVDEAVIAELGYKPARYARSLLAVLQLKHRLQYAAAVPGVRAMDVTSQRLKHILGVGRRRALLPKTPRWCWLVLIVGAFATLPGAALERSSGGDDKKASTRDQNAAQKPSGEESAAGTAEPVVIDPPAVTGVFIGPKQLDPDDLDLPVRHHRATEILKKAGADVTLWRQLDKKQVTAVTIGSGQWTGGREELEQLNELSGPLQLHLDGPAVAPPDLEILRNLPELEFVGFHNATDELLAPLRGIASLKQLIISGDRVTDPGVSQLRDLPNLAVLVIDLPAVTDEGLLQFPDLPSLTHLQLSFPLVGDEGLQVVSRYPHLRYLQIGPCKCTDEAFKHMAALEELENLVVACEGVTGAGVEHLRDTSNLKMLTLTAGKVTDAGCAEIAQLPALERLSINAAEMTDAGLASLTALGRLTLLNLFETKDTITPGGIAQLARLRELKIIGIYGNAHIDEQALRTLATLKDLRSLDLQIAGPTDEGLQHLAALTELRSMSLGGGEVTDEGLMAIAGLTKMRQLQLDHMKITGPGLTSLAGMTRLEWLTLSRNPLDDEGLKNLPELPALKHLDLGYTLVTDDGLHALGKLTRLEVLRLIKTQVTEEGVQGLKNNLPNLNEVITRVELLGWNNFIANPGFLEDE